METVLVKIGRNNCASIIIKLFHENLSCFFVQCEIKQKILILFPLNSYVDNLDRNCKKKRKKEKIAKREYREILKRNYRQSIPQLCHAHNTNRTVNRLWWTRLYQVTRFDGSCRHIRFMKPKNRYDKQERFSHIWEDKNL